MSRKSPREKPPKYVQLPHYMLNSPAWKSLSPVARAVYVDISKRYFGSNNGRVGYSVRCAVKEFDIGVATSKRAIDALQDRGFIVPVKKGAFSYKVRHATEWRLTQFPTDHPTELATKDFMAWTPDKNKTRYPQRNRTVSVAEPIGICSGTSPELNTSHGICSGTVKGVSEAPSVPVAEHIYLASTQSVLGGTETVIRVTPALREIVGRRGWVRPA